MVKRRRLSSLPDSEDSPMCSYTTYMSQGDKLFRCAEYRKAIINYSKALALKPDDPECLCSRGHCQLMLSKPKEALEDAIFVMNTTPTCAKAFWLRAEAMYTAGKFEQALIYFYRGKKLAGYLRRPSFQNGIMKSSEAIDIAVGDPHAIQLDLSGDLSYFKNLALKEHEKRRVIPIVPTRSKEGRLKARHATDVIFSDDPKHKVVHGAKTLKILLNELYGEYEYLDKLSKTTTYNHEANEIIQDALDYLISIGDFWLNREPMFARNYAAWLQQREHISRHPDSRFVTSYLVNMISRINDERLRGDKKYVLSRAVRCLKAISMYPDGFLDKPELLRLDLLIISAECYYDNGNYNNALLVIAMCMNIAEKNDVNSKRMMLMDLSARVYLRQGDYQKAAATWTKKLDIDKTLNTIEKGWLCHEIGRCYFEMRDYHEALMFAEKADMISTGDETLMLYAIVLKAQSYAKLDDLVSAFDFFNGAIRLAEDLENWSVVSSIYDLVSFIESAVRSEKVEVPSTKRTKIVVTNVTSLDHHIM